MLKGRRSKVTHQLVSLVVVEQQRLFERSSDVRVCGVALEVGGGKLGELVLRQVVLIIVLRQRKSLV